jgi:hypothetical protein
MPAKGVRLKVNNQATFFPSTQARAIWVSLSHGKHPLLVAAVIFFVFEFSLFASAPLMT